jgi:Dehydratase family
MRKTMVVCDCYHNRCVNARTLLMWCTYCVYVILVLLCYVLQCVRAGEAIKLLLQKDLKPKDIVTRASFENAMVTVMALGGSTNAVLHLIAMAKAFDVELTLDDFQTVCCYYIIPYISTTNTY